MPHAPISARLPRRRRDGARIAHALVALLFVAAALSGLAFFHPGLYFLSHGFGGGTWTRILHPFFGLALATGCALSLLPAWRGRSAPPSGRRGAWLRKLAVRCVAAGLLLLVATGSLFWRPHVADALPIVVVRIAVLLHALAAVLFIVAAVGYATARAGGSDR